MIFGHVQHLSQTPTIVPILQASPIILPGTRINEENLIKKKCQNINEIDGPISFSCTICIGSVTADSITSKSAIQAIPQAKTVNTTIVTTVASSTVSMPQLHSHLAKAITENKSSVVQTSLTVSAVVTSSPK